MCLGGHLAFRCALDSRILASVCYFPTDIHDEGLSSTGSDTLVRAGQGEIQGEAVLIFGVQDGHIVRFCELVYESSHTHIDSRPQPLEGRTKIRSALTNPSIQPPLRLSFLELQANHAFIRDEMSKGRFDAAISKVCFELLLETFGRTIGRDLG
jgi:carboxymethylenebutenolidase